MTARLGRDAEILAAAADQLLQRDKPGPDKSCAMCRVNTPGPGGVICRGCRAAIEARNAALIWWLQGHSEPDEAAGGGAGADRTG